MLLLLESLALTVCAGDLRDWFPRSPEAHALQSIVGITSTALMIVFIAMLPLAMMDLLTRNAAVTEP